MKKTINTLLFLLIMAGFAFADQVTLSPTDDMYTDPDHAGTSPTITQLWTANYSGSGHFERIMIKFDLSPYIGQNATSAVLNLTRLFSCPSTGTTVTKFYPITESWSEETWDHTQNISYNSSINMSYSFWGDGGSVIKQFQVDITDFLNNFLNGTVENNGFVIIANSGQHFSKFYSKEFSNSSYRPTLDLTTGAAVDDPSQQGVTFLSNYPNPFSEETTISFSAQKSIGHSNIVIYDIKGRIIQTFSLSNITPYVSSNIVWDGNDRNGKPVPNGIYFCKVQADDTAFVQKMMLLR